MSWLADRAARAAARTPALRVAGWGWARPLPAMLLIAALLSAGCAAPAPPAPTAAVGAPTAAPTAERPTPTTAPTAAATATPAEAAAPSATPAAAPLLIWAVVPSGERDALVRLLEETARQVGAPAMVVAKSADAFSADLVAGRQAGLAPPDLIWGGGDDLFLLLRAGAIQPAEDGLDELAYLPAAIAGATAGGERWGTPVAARGALLLLYNRRLVEGAPRTTDDLLAQARAQRQGGRAGLVAGWIEMRWLAAWAEGYGGALLSPDGRPSLSTQPITGSLELLSALRSAGPPPPSTYAEGARLFRSGQAAFAIDGDWSLRSYRAYSETLDLGIAPLPTVSGSGRPAIGPLEGVYLMYASGLGGGRLAAARQIGAALAAEPAQLRIAAEVGYLPARRDALRSGAVLADPALAAAAAHALDAPAIAPTVAQRCVWLVGEPVLPMLLLREITLAETVERLQARAEACVAEVGGGP